MKFKIVEYFSLQALVNDFPISDSQATRVGLVNFGSSSSVVSGLLDHAGDPSGLISTISSLTPEGGSANFASALDTLADTAYTCRLFA